MKEYFRNSWDPADYKQKELAPEIQELLTANFSERFIDLMRNRMLMGIPNYGQVFESMVPRDDGGPEKVIDAVESANKRIAKYYGSGGNVEFLVDAANFLMMEFMYPSHKTGHFHPTDSDQSPGRVEKSSGELVHHSNRDLL